MPDNPMKCDADQTDGLLGRRRILVFLLLLVAPLLLAYLPSFRAPFIFDDTANILENPTIRSLWPPWGALNPPGLSGLVGRPLVNLSLALNFAISGTAPWSYHLVNLAIHACSSILLWALLHELLARLPIPSKYEIQLRQWLPWICALLWGLHPLQTQAVTYVIQRCESLMGLFYLGTVYAYVRAGGSRRPFLWQGLGVASFFACLGCKEVAVTLLPATLAMAWVLNGQDPVQAIRKVPLFFGSILAALVVLAVAMVFGHGYVTHSNQLVGSGLDYTMTQGTILLRYLRLAIWPSDLTLDYGWPVGLPGETWFGALLVLALLLTTAWLLFRRHWTGLLGAIFFIILAPTSLVPLPDLIYEHRMYLPLATVLCLIIGSLLALSIRVEARLPQLTRVLPMALLALALPLGWRTFRRNQDYRSAATIWSDTLQKRPLNFRAYHGLAGALAGQGDLPGSLPLLRRAASLNPLSYSVRNDLGITLIKLQQPQEAIPELRAAVSFSPTNPVAHNNLGAAYLLTDHLEEATVEFQTALRLKPDYLSPRRNLEVILSKQGADHLRRAR